MSLAKSNKFKTFSVISFNNEKSKNGKIKSIEEYDSNGKIVNRKEYYSSASGYWTSVFGYDSLNFLINVYTTYSNPKDYYTTMNIGIGSNGKAKYIVEGNQKHLVLGDTLHYCYNGDGAIRYKYFSGRGDTIYYHYEDNGRLRKFSRKSYDTEENRLFDKNGCITGYTDFLDSDGYGYETIYECDSLCNITSRIMKWHQDGIGTITDKGEYKYENGRLVEAVEYQCPKSDYTKCKGELRFWYHTKYEYYDNGLLKQEKSYNKAGKLIEVVKYIYDYY